MWSITPRRYKQDLILISWLPFTDVITTLSFEIESWDRSFPSKCLSLLLSESAFALLPMCFLFIANVLSIGFSMKTYFCRVETVTFQNSLNYQAGNTETYQSEPLKCLSKTQPPHIYK